MMKISKTLTVKLHFLNIYKMCLTQKLTSITFNYHLLAIIK